LCQSFSTSHIDQRDIRALHRHLNKCAAQWERAGAQKVTLINWQTVFLANAGRFHLSSINADPRLIKEIISHFEEIQGKLMQNQGNLNGPLWKHWKVFA
jgi:hypothetical protein